jgi:HEAT repeat protein
MAGSSSPQVQSKPKSASPAPAPSSSPAVSAFGVTIAEKTKSAEAQPMSKQKKQAIMAGALFVLVALVLWWQFAPSTTTDPAIAANPEIKPVVQAEQKKDIPQLQQFARDNNPIVASRAVTALGQLGDTSTIDSASRDGRKEVRLAAVSALSNAPDGAKLASLQRFTADPSSDVRLQALAGIANVKSFEIFDPLMKMLEDPDPTVRNAAIKAIEEKIGLKFTFYDPKNPSPAAVGRIKAQMPKYRSMFERYMENTAQTPRK